MSAKRKPSAMENSSAFGDTTNLESNPIRSWSMGVGETNAALLDAIGQIMALPENLTSLEIKIAKDDFPRIAATWFVKPEKPSK